VRDHVELSAKVPRGRIRPSVDRPAQRRRAVFLVSEVEVRAWINLATRRSSPSIAAQ
jgi:hypothetical protein